MGSTGADNVPKDTDMEGSETTIEIKLKTLDSQTYTLRVDKQMPVPALKEQIASVTGVLSEQQRLICRGKVLKDDQLLSAYHVEDGHTLHLVDRQPIPPSFDGSPNHSANDPTSGTSHGHSSHVPSVLIETFNVPDQGDGVPPEISRIVSAVLGSFGFPNLASGGIRSDATAQTEQASTTSHSNRTRSTFGLPAAVPFGPMQPPVIPDSLATLSQYLSHIRNEFDAVVAGRAGVNDSETASMSRTGLNSGTVREGLPTPSSLAEALLSTRQMLIEQVGESLQQLARQLEDQGNVTDPSARLLVQSNGLRIGTLLHNLGSLLLELGRTTMTLRLGQTSSETVVNAGPAVFISPSGPNPLMVQPLPLQAGTSFGAIPVGTVPGSGLVNGVGTGFLPRRIDIQIRRGSSMATPNSTDRENRSTQPTSRVRVVPVRTMVAAGTVPLGGRLPTESSGNSARLLGRLQNIIPGDVSDERVSQASGEHVSPGAQPEQLPIPESAVQHQSPEVSARDGSQATTGSVQGQAETSSDAPAAEPNIADQGVFLSNLLHQIMPYISQHEGSQQRTAEEATTSYTADNSSTENSRRPSDPESNPPNSKRQKME